MTERRNWDWVATREHLDRLPVGTHVADSLARLWLREADGWTPLAPGQNGSPADALPVWVVAATQTSSHVRSGPVVTEAQVQTAARAVDPDAFADPDGAGFGGLAALAPRRRAARTTAETVFTAVGFTVPVAPAHA